MTLRPPLRWRLPPSRIESGRGDTMHLSSPSAIPPPTPPPLWRWALPPQRASSGRLVAAHARNIACASFTRRAAAAWPSARRGADRDTPIGLVASSAATLSSLSENDTYSMGTQRYSMRTARRNASNLPPPGALVEATRSRARIDAVSSAAGTSAKLSETGRRTLLPPQENGHATRSSWPRLALRAHGPAVREFFCIHFFLFRSRRSFPLCSVSSWRSPPPPLPSP